MLLSRHNPISLLDNAPLRDDAREATCDFERIQGNIDSGALYAVCVTASGYTSGQSVSFFQGGSGLRGLGAQPAHRRRGQHQARLPARLGRAAVHLPGGEGAPRVLRRRLDAPDRAGEPGAAPRRRPRADRRHRPPDAPTTRARARTPIPSLAQIAGHALNSIFLDSLMVDIERLERINRTVKLIPPEKLAESNVPLRAVKVLFITPSQPIERIASRFIHELPRTVRFVLRPTGALNRSGSNLASYLLFEESFCRALIDLGYQDTVGARSRGARFLRPGRKPRPCLTTPRRRTRSRCSAACGGRSACRCPAWRCRPSTRRKSRSASPSCARSRRGSP